MENGLRSRDISAGIKIDGTAQSLQRLCHHLGGWLGTFHAGAQHDASIEAQRRGASR